MHTLSLSRRFVYMCSVGLCRPNWHQEEEEEPSWYDDWTDHYGGGAVHMDEADLWTPWRASSCELASVQENDSPESPLSGSCQHPNQMDTSSL